MPLSSQQTERLRCAVMSRLAELEREVDDKLGEAARNGAEFDRAADSGEQSVQENLTTADFADARRDLEEHRAGRAALDRLASGTYGQCIDCGLDIEAARLHAQPFAARCLYCQDKLERAGRFHSTTL